jgi:hypothetical protein
MRRWWGVFPHSGARQVFAVVARTATPAAELIPLLHRVRGYDLSS